jgi:hypothetical protein
MPMNAAKLLLLNVLGGSAEPVTYLFRDEFTTDEAAPLASPRTAEPGPGVVTLVDTANTMSIASGALTMVKGSSGTATDPIYRTGPYTRETGLALITRYKRGQNYSGVGWMASTSFGVSSQMLYADFGMKIRPSGAVTIPLAVGAYGVFGIVLRSSGAWIFNLTTGELAWWDDLSNPASLYAALGSVAAGPIDQAMDYLYIRQLPAPFTTDHGFATLNIASPTDATEYTGDADGIIDLTVTAPGTLDGSASTRCGFYYRADSDLSPAWHCYVDGTGAFNLDSIDAAGTRTNRISVAGVITGGATRTLRVIAVGTKHNAYSLSGTTWAKHGAEITLSLNNAVTTIEPSVPAGWTAADLRSYPRTSPAYAELDRT